MFGFLLTHKKIRRPVRPLSRGRAPRAVAALPWLRGTALQNGASQRPPQRPLLAAPGPACRGRNAALVTAGPRAPAARPVWAEAAVGREAGGGGGRSPAGDRNEGTSHPLPPPRSEGRLVLLRGERWWQQCPCPKRCPPASAVPNVLEGVSKKGRVAAVVLRNPPGLSR